MRDSDFRAVIAGLENQGVSKTEIARRAGMSYATVWRIANGIGKNHFIDTGERLKQVQRAVEQNSRVNKFPHE